MTTRFPGRFVCLFRGHRWRAEFNRETQGTEADCSRCGAHKSTYPGATGRIWQDQATRFLPIHGGRGRAGTRVAWAGAAETQVACKGTQKGAGHDARPLTRSATFLPGAAITPHPAQASSAHLPG